MNRQIINNNVIFYLSDSGDDGLCYITNTDLLEQCEITLSNKFKQILGYNSGFFNININTEIWSDNIMNMNFNDEMNFDINGSILRIFCPEPYYSQIQREYKDLNIPHSISKLNIRNLSDKNLRNGFLFVTIIFKYSFEFLIFDLIQGYLKTKISINHIK